ncbi:hypothetical protein [Pedobacter sp. SL55]|uniref:hypothetical protein n=1 Tax=Pedobacter sp. SL55 TaxID=2995161 RepID=UPI0022700AAF|nr:hypothetical protein [Pedobacter sp. SL55]WAC41197.1 hypothetical protein OVA16_02140 [Pedobacter sp. SL55]
MKKYLLLLFLCVGANQIRAQHIIDSALQHISTDKSRLNNKEYFRLFIVKSMINAIDFDKLIKAPKGFAQLASVSVVFNNKGIVDTSIVTSKLNENFELKKNPTAELKCFKPILEYANSTVILPILYIRMDETSINLENKILEEFVNLFPHQFLNKKNVILLKPEVNPFSQIK